MKLRFTFILATLFLYAPNFGFGQVVISDNSATVSPEFEIGRPYVYTVTKLRKLPDDDGNMTENSSWRSVTLRPTKKVEKGYQFNLVLELDAEKGSIDNILDGLTADIEYDFTTASVKLLDSEAPVASLLKKLSKFKKKNKKNEDALANAEKIESGVANADGLTSGLKSELRYILGIYKSTFNYGMVQDTSKGKDFMGNETNVITKKGFVQLADGSYKFEYDRQNDLSGMGDAMNKSVEEALKKQLGNTDASMKIETNAQPASKDFKTISVNFHSKSGVMTSFLSDENKSIFGTPIQSKRTITLEAE